jgi:hypothetical protein
MQSTQTKKALKTIYITGGILILITITGALANAWGANIPTIVLAWGGWLWIPIGLLVWRNKI